MSWMRWEGGSYVIAAVQHSPHATAFWMAATPLREHFNQGFVVKWSRADLEGGGGTKWIKCFTSRVDAFTG